MITIQRSDIGIQFICTIKDEQTDATIDMSQASNINFIFRQPDKTVYTVAGSLYSDGKDGRVSYTSQTTDLGEAGIWKFQVSYSLSGSTKLTSPANFQVIPNLSDL